MTTDITGQKFGRLTALNFSHKMRDKSYWSCLCDCGKKKNIRADGLKNGNTRSCGCLQKEKATIHGIRYTRLYKIWKGIKQRCYNEKSTNYKNYGGRGITICYEWKNNAEVFYDWAIANGYEEELTIDRINNDGNYEPNNCRWTTNKEQARNKRSNINIEFQGQTKCLKEWAEILGIKYRTLASRINKYGWSVEEALEMGERRRW